MSKPNEETKENVINFITKLYEIIDKFNDVKLCFFSGSFIFKDDNNRLYNLLLNNVDDEDNINKEFSNEKKIETENIKVCPVNKNLSSHVTTTHKQIFKKDNIKSDNNCYSKYNNIGVTVFKSFLNSGDDAVKFEYNLMKDKQELKCYGETVDDESKKIKGVILFYRFKDINKLKDNKFVFFKLEGHNMNSVSHSIRAAATYKGGDVKRKILKSYTKLKGGKLDTRRENLKKEETPTYKTTFYDKDVSFYKKVIYIYPELAAKIPGHNLSDKEQYCYDKLNDYDVNYRTGNEFYVIEELKNFILDEAKKMPKNISISQLHNNNRFTP